MSELKLGQIIDGVQYRDAIHIAVAPVIAGEQLEPGEDIGFSDGYKSVVSGASSAKPIGIVDPFLKDVVVPGQQFWMFLYPNTVTSMRHEWQHPAFGVSSSREQDKESMDWLISYGEEVNMTLKELLDVTREYLKTGDIHCLGFDTPEIVWDKRSEFWQHYARYTGESVEVGKDDTFFRCAC